MSAAGARQPDAGAEPPRGLNQSLAADLEDVPLPEALTVIARRLGLQLERRDAAGPAARMTANIPRVSADVLLLVLAWQTDREYVAASGVLRWGPAQDLPSAELAAYRRERTLRLEHEASLLRSRLREPLPFRLKVEDVPLADILRFLQRELAVPLFLDPRAADELKAPVRSELADPTQWGRPGPSADGSATLAELLDRLLSGPSGSDRGSTSATATEGAGRSVSRRTRQSAGGGERAKGAPGPGGPAGSGPAPVRDLGWTVVGDLVVVSTPAHLYNLRSLSR